MAADVEQIASLRAHQQPLPLITYREVSYTLETCNDDLDANELELMVQRAWNLHGAREATAGPMDVFVQWDNGLEGGKGTSPTVTKQREPGKLPLEDDRTQGTAAYDRAMQYLTIGPSKRFSATVHSSVILNGKR